jgi:hypothetical protein
MATEIGKAFSTAEDAVWTEVAPGNRRAVLLERPELMLVALERGVLIDTFTPRRDDFMS